MYKSFLSIDELFAHMREDKEWKGAEAALRNRYPVRFVLFENFADFNEFVLNRSQEIFAFSIDRMTGLDHPDLFPTITELSRIIASYITHLPANDHVIYPFSELGRFYAEKEFFALVKTIKGVEPPADAQAEHTRVYIPLVGMQGKMDRFMDDAQAFVWEYKSSVQSGVYQVVLTSGSTFGVRGLEGHYTIAHNLREWLSLWKQGERVSHNIICSSKNIYLNAHHAQPDNAFSYVVCPNAYEFLTQGLGLDFGDMPAKEEELPMWERLAGLIDIDNFDLRSFVNEHFDTAGIHNTEGFIKSWMECENDFDRWLLAMYIRKVSCGRGYICEVLNRCGSLSTSELFSVIADGVFDGLATDEYIKLRRQSLSLAAKQGVKITERAERKVYAKLSAMLCGSEEDRHRAIGLMTDFTDSDKRLAIEAYSKGYVSLQKLNQIYPDFYYYLDKMGIQLPAGNGWVIDYFDAYRKAKAMGDIQPVQALLHERNSSAANFEAWYGDFKTVKTCLHERNDIDVIYWIDGLGVDWVPFIAHIISKHRMEGVFLNEVYIACAALPSTTSKNKPLLEALLPEGRKLEKTGDLDSFAHQYKNGYPQYLIDEMHIVEESINKVLQGYNGRKIAFVSDHGMSYMAQYGKGLNLADVEGDHEGRVAHKKSGKAVADSKYIVLDDGKTLCALTEDSLTVKTHKGHGAHGGATPEEVLVPIIIVSSQENASNYSARLMDNEICATNPVLRLTIKGLTSIDVPKIEYNNVEYSLTKETSDIFASERLNLEDTATRVTLHIGSYRQHFTIKISTGAQEINLFGDL